MLEMEKLISKKIYYKKINYKSLYLFFTFQLFSLYDHANFNFQLAQSFLVKWLEQKIGNRAII